MSRVERAALPLTVAGLAGGGALWLAGERFAADLAWAATVAIVLVPLAWSVGRDLLHRETGVDVIALLAMAGAVALHEYLAGAVVALMLSGGQALERYAGERARRELSALVSRAPKNVTLYAGGELKTVDAAEVKPGDRLLVRPGDVVPVDGVVVDRPAVLDESALTGESLPVERRLGDEVRSGVVNAGSPFDLRATATADRSTYAAIVRLVREAERSKAPFVRLADRYALWFLPATLLTAVAAGVLARDPVRALAVLVVATPCPLILAAPVAIVAGISRCAHRGVIVKGGGALETLGRAQTLIFDKTGTLTAGAPRVTAVESFDGIPLAEVLRLAAALDQVSPHVLARALVEAAAGGEPLPLPTDVEEVPGNGIAGLVEGRRVALGRARWLAGDGDLPEAAASLRERCRREGLSSVFVSVDGVLAGAVIVEDTVRADTPAALAALREAGVRRIVVLTGDRASVAERVAGAVGVDTVLAERTPADKVEAVLDERRTGVTVMVGDGINDAPALAAADVGVAMGARGATVSSEVADAVVMVDRLDRVAEAVAIARCARAIAVQSVVAGMALSMVGMALAAVGLLPPIAGAVFQEAIDVAVILNALRALAPPAPHTRSRTAERVAPAGA